MKYLKSKVAVLLYAVFIMCFISFGFYENTFYIFQQRANQGGYSWSTANMVTPYTCMLIGLLFLCNCFVKHVKREEKKSVYVIFGLLSAVFSFISFMGRYYTASQSQGLIQIIKEQGVLLGVGICFFGGCVMFFFAFLAIKAICSWLNEKVFSDQVQKIGNFLFEKHCFLKSCLVMAVCWLPHVIIRYPGASWIDSFNSLAQYYGVKTMTTQHPIVYTALMGKLTDWGISMGDGAYGLFVLTMAQTLATLLILAYTITTMKKLKVPNWCCGVGLFAFSVMPTMVSCATTAMIDAPYCAAFLLLFNQFVRYLYCEEEYKKSWKDLLLTVAAVAGTFFRYNGLYIVAILLVVTALREAYLLLRKKQKVVFSVLIILAIFVPMVGGRKVTSHLNQVYQAEAISTRAKFAMPIQHIARYMVYHSEDLSKEEAKTIKKVLKYTPEQFKQKYTPKKFDGVKAGFNNDATAEELKDFLVLWVKLFFRHPGTYIEATVCQNHYLFNPLVDNCRYYQSAQTDSVTENFDYSRLYVGNSDSEFWNQMRQKLFDYYRKFTSLPILGMLVNQGWYTLLLFGICIYAIYKKDGKILLMSLPLLATLGIVFIGPAVYGHQRYTFPIIYSMPLFAGIYSRDLKELEGECDE